MQPADVRELEERLGVRFTNREVLHEALRHTSYLIEHPDQALRSNERLEFLGDAVLGYLAAEYLYELLPDADEGYLTELRASVIRGVALASFAEELRLDRYVWIGRGLAGEMGIGKPQLPADLRPRQRVLGRMMESLIGAVLIDQGLEAVRSIVIPYLEAAAARSTGQAASEKAGEPEHDPSLALLVQTANYKTALQELAQRNLRITPRYVVVGTSGLPHALEFKVEVRLGDRTVATASGMSKQRATQAAAKAALDDWERIERDFAQSS